MNVVNLVGVTVLVLATVVFGDVDDDDVTQSFTNGVETITVYGPGDRVERDVINDVSCVVRSADVPDLTSAHPVDDETLEYVRSVCQGAGKDRNKRLFIKPIFPATKWCGMGNKSEHHNDFGLAKETDMCCRNHDLCKPGIPPGKTAYGTTNNMFYYMKSCKCDKAFKSCLNRVRGFFDWPAAESVKYLFFTFLNVKCFNH